MELKDTIELMNSADYKDRLIAEYWQTKIRYEKLKNLNNKLEARVHSRVGEDFIDFLPSCDSGLLSTQQKNMGEYLHCLEMIAIIEGIDLEKGNK